MSSSMAGGGGGGVESPSSSDKTSWDLTPEMSRFFDPHMINVMLDFLGEVGLYEPKLISKQKIKVMVQTNLVDGVDDEYQKFADDIEMQQEYEARKASLEAKRVSVFEQLDNPPEDVKFVEALMKNEDKVAELKLNSNWTLEYLTANEGITLAMLEGYYAYAKFKYESGIYSDAEEMLGEFLSITQPGPVSAAYIGALWGRLACRVLQGKWIETVADLAQLKETIEGRNFSSVDQIRQRAWLLHWGMFVYMNQKEGQDSIADFFSERAYLQTMENLCPWMLRYYTAAVILSPSRRSKVLRELLNEIQSMHYLYTDPITQFLESLYTNFDFDEAQVRLVECQQLLRQDYFLQIFCDDFMHQARVLICEMYCTINARVDLNMLGEKLQMSVEESEKWMVDMVRGTTAASVNDKSSLDARIDSSGKQVIMIPPAQSTQQQVLDKTRDLTHRSTVIASALDGVLKESAEFLKARGN